MKEHRFKLNTGLVVKLLLIWFIFQSVLSGSLFEYSDYKGILALVGSVTLLLRYFMMAFGVYWISRKRLKRKYFIPLVVYVLIVVITKINANSWLFFDVFFIAFIFRDAISREQTIKVFFMTILISCVVVILANYAGLFPNYVVRRLDGRERMHLGFAHPNTLGYYIMICSFLIVLICKEKINFFHIIALIIVAYFVYVYPNSFSSAISILLMSIYLLVKKLYFLLFKKNVVKSRLIRIASITIVPIIVFIIFWIVSNSFNFTYMYDTFGTFYSRFRFGSQAIQQYGIHLFGSKDIAFVGTAARFFGGIGSEYFTIDCLYIFVLVRYGIIPSFFIAAVYVMCIRASIKKQDSDILAILVIFSVYSINESMFLAVPTSFVFIISSQYIFHMVRKKE